MRTRVQVGLMLVLAWAPLRAAAGEPGPAGGTGAYGHWAFLRPTGVGFIASAFREAYPAVAPGAGLGVRLQLPGRWRFHTAVDTWEARGDAVGGGTMTFRMLPLEAGLEADFPVRIAGRGTPYAGWGVRYSCYREAVEGGGPSRSGNGLGFALRGGVMVTPVPRAATPGRFRWGVEAAWVFDRLSASSSSGTGGRRPNLDSLSLAFVLGLGF